MGKSISFSDYRTFLKCPAQFQHRMIYGWKAPTTKEAVANALHAIAEHGGDMKRAARQVERQLNMLSDADREVARAELAERVPAVVELVSAEPDSIREKVYRWHDEVSGWVLCAKPDRLCFVNDRLMEITDYKDTTTVSRWQRDQLFFFALVLSKALNFNNKIRMVIKRFKEQDQPGMVVEPVSEFYYSHHRTPAALDMLRADLRKIDQYLESGSFPVRPDWYCEGCAMVEQCQPGQNHLRDIGRLSVSVSLPVIVVGNPPAA